MGYNPEPYWSRVATEIRKRGPNNCLAGNDNPFFRYKRKKVLARFLSTMDFDSKVVLEVGCGPGGNLLQIVQTRARRVIGIDISKEMLDLAAKTIKGYETIVELHKTDGEHLPLADEAVDLAFTVTVLQHNTDPYMFQSLVGEICRVAKHTVVLMEDTGRDFVGPSFMVRPVGVYAAECRKHKFQLTDCRYLGLRISRMAYALVRHLLVSPSHPEGKPFEFLPVAALRVLLSLTWPFDEVIPDKGDLTRMVFERDSAA